LRQRLQRFAGFGIRGIAQSNFHVRFPWLKVQSPW
jgi:hypothetical protein